MPFVMLTSIKGRRLGLSSTGGIVSGYNSTGGMSTAIDLAAVMRDSTGAIIGRHYEPMTTISSSGATLQEGLNYISELEPRSDPDTSDKSLRGAVELNYWGSYVWGNYLAGAYGCEILGQAAMPVAS